MSLKDLIDIKFSYRNKHDDVVNNFYIPCLLNSYTYMRAVGYFSSSILTNIARGLTSYLSPGHKIQLLISPEISEDDYQVIKHASFSEETIDAFIEKKLNFSSKKIEMSRYSLLYHLIKLNILEIKFAVVSDYEKSAIYHEKIGIFVDKNGDSITFVGSSNETESAILRNYESFLSFKSWDNHSAPFCSEQILHFNKLWTGSDPYIKTLNITKAIENKVIKFANEDPFFGESNGKKPPLEQPPININDKPYIKEGITLKPFQVKAIENFVDNNFKGIYSMSTGSGKTFTAAATIVRLNDIKKRVFVVIVAPFLHLVDQWSDELENFNIKPLKIYGLKTDWINNLKIRIELFKNYLTNFTCVVVTNKTFSDKDFQNEIQPILNECLLIVDEAHNFGSKKLLNVLSDKIQYRLALSATIERHNDQEGTEALVKYFDKIVIEYTLKNAMLDKVLTKYYYYPILTHLSETELEKYIELSVKISQLFAIQSNNRSKNSQELENLLIKRSRVISGSVDKLVKLESLLKERYLNDKNLLVYCGALSYGDTETFDIQEDKKQIEYVQELMGVKLGMKVSKFTAEESRTERQEIITAYKNNDLQALIAIRCLDEGVNIPAIKTAFILASSTNPRQYVQRRGRLLRTYPGKNFSVIYDFISISRPENEVKQLSDKELEIEKKIVINEIKRIKEFSEIALNSSDSFSLIDRLVKMYKIGIIEIKEIGG